MSPAYRQWLQALVNNGGGLPAQEASALLQVVGDDFGVNEGFINQQQGDDGRYIWEGASPNYDPTRGQVFSTTGGEGENTGYGPQGIQRLNEIYKNKYNTVYGGSRTGSLGGGSAGTAQDMADEQAYWDDQLANADQQLGRIPTQEEILRKNAEDAYKSAYERLVGDKNKSKRDFDTKKQTTIDDNISAKGDIDTSVRQRNTGLQRLLGSRGAGNSSAAQILAPFAAAQEGNIQRGQVQKAYGRNLQGLDTAWGDYEDDWNESAGDLSAQRDNTVTQGVAGLRQTEADLLEAKSNAAVQKQMAGGANYQTARGQRIPYSERIKQLIGQIDQAGAAKTFTPKSAAYKAPELASYTYDRYAAPAANSGVNPGAAQQTGAYWTLLGKDKEKRV